MSEMIKFACGNCGAKIKAGPKVFGKVVSCPACGGSCVVPDGRITSLASPPPVKPRQSQTQRRRLPWKVFAGIAAACVLVLCIVVFSVASSPKTPRPVAVAELPAPAPEHVVEVLPPPVDNLTRGCLARVKEDQRDAIFFDSDTTMNLWNFAIKSNDDVMLNDLRTSFRVRRVNRGNAIRILLLQSDEIAFVRVMEGHHLHKSGLMYRADLELHPKQNLDL